MAEGEGGFEDGGRPDGDDVATNWSAGAAVAEADRFIRGLNLPRMRRPDGLGGEYVFPSNARELDGYELGSLQLQLSGWYTYLLDQKGRVDAELGALRSVYEIALGEAMAETKQAMLEEGGWGKVIASEILRARAVKTNEKLGNIARLVVTKEATIRRLDVQAEIYHEQLTRLSREQSRREAEARL